MNSLLIVWINGMAAVIADKDLFIFAIVMEVIGIISCHDLYAGCGVEDIPFIFISLAVGFLWIITFLSLLL